MDTKLLSPAVAIVDRQTNPEDDSDGVKLQKIWRWLDAIHECEPPEEQPAFNDCDKSPDWLLDQEYRSKVFKQNQQQLLFEQAKKDQALMGALQTSSLAPKPSQGYGRVQILRRAPTSGSGGERNTNLGIHIQAASGNEDYKAPPTSLNQGKVETSRQFKRSKTFAERAKDLFSPAALYSPSTKQNRK